MGAAKAPNNRQLRGQKMKDERNHEIITLEGVMSSNVSIDKITKFSLRPPEIRNIVTELGNYYRWFLR